MKFNKLFVIVDPTSENTVLLDRVARVAQRAESADQVSVTAYCCTYSNLPSVDPKTLEKVAIKRSELWLDYLFSDLKATGVNVTYQIEWHADWREAVPNAVAAADCDLVIKNSYSHRSEIGRLAKQIDRAILRAAKSPVGLLRRGEASGSGVLLVALKTTDLDEPHKRANEKVLAHCKALADANSRYEVHAVSCYPGSENFIYPDDLAKLAGIDRTRAHVFDGSPVKGIESLANKLDAELVFMGSVAKEGIAGRLLGTTADQILDSLNSDIVAYVERN